MLQQVQARKAKLVYAFFSPISAVVIALTIMLVGFSWLGASWLPGAWWLWLSVGLLAEGVVLQRGLHNEQMGHRLRRELFRRQFDLTKLRQADLQAQCDQALEYHHRIMAEIERETEPVLDDYLYRIVGSLEQWIAELYRLAQGLDLYQHDTVIARDLQAVPGDLARLKSQLSQEPEAAVKAELEKTIATKQAQWNSLQALQGTMARAGLQLENTLSTMGTIYMQVVHLGAKDIDSGRVRRLQAEMSDQVLALEDISAAMDEVYRASGGG